MVQQVSTAAASVAASIKPVAPAQAQNNVAAAKPVKTQTQKAVPALSELNARTFLQRQQIGAALYDRSFTLREGARTMNRQDAIQAYAEQIQMQAGGPSAKELRRLERMLNNADRQIARLQNNNQGANLSSVEGIDGRDMDIVQENLAARIQHGLKDGSLTQQEAESLLARQQELADLESKLRASDGKLTAGEQKMVLDQLRKTADEINQARNNGTGVNLGSYDYAQSVTDRQAALQKQLDANVKNGALTETEAELVLVEFEKVAAMKAEAQASGRIDWREATNLSSAMNTAEALMYDLTRNKSGTQLAHSYVDVKYVDMREAQQLESIVRGIDNGRLTNEEAETLLRAQQGIQNLEQRLVDGGLNRSEYLRLQTEMNDFALQLSDLYNNRDRFTGIIPPSAGGGSGGTSSGGAATGGGASGGSSGTGGGTPAAGNGGSQGAGAPVVAPAPATPAPASPPPSQALSGQSPATPPAVEAKPEPSVVKPEPAPAPVFPDEIGKLNLKLQEIKDRFGEFMTGMLRERNKGVRSLNDKLAEAARQRHEDESRRSESRRQGGDTVGKNGSESSDRGSHAEITVKLQSYATAAQAAKAPEPPMTKKVA